MINGNRIFAMVLRDLINLRHSYDRLSDMFYWPVMDLLIWGLTGLYFVQQNNNQLLLSVILTGLIFWIVVWRSQYEININLLHEIWDRNLINLFASPLTLAEWIISFLIFGLTKMIISLSFSALIATLLYKYNLFIYGFLLIPFVLSLLLTGWVVGFIVAGFLIRFGQRLQTLGWTGVYLIAPFSVIFYSLSILPPWAQTIAKFVPPSYVFEGMREIIFTGRLSYDKLLISLGLNLIYLILSIAFFVFMFNRSRKLGLGRLM